MITIKKKFRVSAQPFNILNLFHFDPDVRNWNVKNMYRRTLISLNLLLLELAAYLADEK